MNSFIYFNTQFCIISNHVTVFAPIVGTWWPALLLVQGMGFGSQGQGDVRRQLQTGGPAPSIQQCDCPQPLDGVQGPEGTHLWQGEYDRSTQPLDGEVIMRVGGDKKHGRYWIGDNTLNTATTPTLSQIRATRRMSSSPAIFPWSDTTRSRMEAL